MGYYTQYKIKFEVLDDSAQKKEFDEFIEALVEADITVPDSITIQDTVRDVTERIHDFMESDDFCTSESCNAYRIQEDVCKWYEHEYDMRLVSRKFPGVLWTLTGEGEESGDLWRKYFWNGKMQTARAELIYPAFDESKLR